MGKQFLDKIKNVMKKGVLEDKFLRALVLLGLATLLLGGSYAYWTGTVSGNENAKNNTMTTANLIMDFTDGKEMRLENSDPGKQIKKTLYITNDGDESVSYNVLWDELVNTFVDTSDVEYEISGSGAYISSEELPESGNDIPIVTNIKIEPKITHSYTLIIKYLKKDEDQSDNEGKSVYGKLRININKTKYEDNLVDVIINKAPNSTNTPNSEGLMAVEQGITDQLTYQTDFRYSGLTVQNYITFNDETWRIIGVTGTDNGNGKIENRVKIVKDSFLTDKKNWNTSKENDWTKSTIKTYLNGEYYNSLTSTAKSLIDDAKWYVNPTSPDYSTYYSYVNERGLSGETHEGYDIKSKKSSKGIVPTSFNGTFMGSSGASIFVNPTWIGKVGLIYPSDYGMASSACFMSSTSLKDYDSSTCINSNWFSPLEDYFWTISPDDENSYTSLAVATPAYALGSYNVDVQSLGVLPAVYLKPEVIVTGGTGLSFNPYTIDLPATTTPSTDLGDIKTVKFSNVTTTGLKIKWNAVDNATYYKLERKKGIGAFTTVSKKLTTTEYTESSLTANTSYTYRIQACNASGCNENKAVKTVTTAINIGTISSFTSSNITTASVDLSWTAATNATYYKLERKAGRESYYVVNESINGLSTTDQIKRDGTDYTYRLRGCAKNDSEVEYCGEPTTLVVTTELYVGQNGIPNANSIIPNAVLLSWTEAENADYYQVARKASGDADYTILSSNLENLSYNDSGLTASTSYTYKVTACNNSFSTEVCAESTYLTITTADSIGAISSFTTANVESQTLTLNYSSATNASYYKIERKKSSDSSYSTITNDETGLSYNDSGLAGGTTYYYRVSPCAKSSTNTEYCGTSQTLNVKTPFEPMPLNQYIISISPTSTGTINSDGLMKVSQSATGQTPAQTEYRYSGGISNNYVSFNSEVWRIVGVFSIDDGTGTYENRVRMIKAEKLASSYSWNSSGTNDWTGASLKTYLNGDYYNSLSSDAQNMIGNAKWYISAISHQAYASNAYSGERASTSSASGSYTNWTGKVAIMYASDYGYASSGCYEGSSNLYWYDNNECKTNNWMYIGGINYWTLAPNTSGTSNGVNVTTSGYASSSGVSTAYSIFPEVHLKSNVKITGGTGTSYDPFTIAGSTELEEPGNATYSNLTTSAVQVSWGAAANATYYKLERRTGEGSYTTVSNNVTTNSYSDSGLTAGTTYTYRVTACNTSGCHATTKTTTITTASALSEINTLSYTNLESRKVTLNWTSATNATYYKIEKKLSSASTYSTVTNNASALSRTVTGLSPSTSYDFKVIPCATSSTDTEYCGTGKTLTVTTEASYDDADTLADEIIGKAPTTTGTINSEGLMKVEQAATGQTPSQTEYRYSGGGPGYCNQDVYEVIDLGTMEVQPISKSNCSGQKNVCVKGTNEVLIDGSFTETKCGEYGGTVSSKTLTWAETSEVKNYITFNNEMWRIIGVFSTDDGTGTYENRVRIMKETKLTDNQKWNSNCTYSYNGIDWSITSGTCNDWTTSSLKTYLNGTYYNGLSDTAKSQIDDAKWYINPITLSGSVGTAQHMYTNERGTTGTTTINSSGATTSRATNWTGKIGLLYGSDWGYGSSTCYGGTKTIQYYDENLCNKNDWMNTTDYDFWLLSPNSEEGYNSLYQTDSGYGGVVSLCDVPNENTGVRPVTHLKSDVVITGGTGTSDDPYTITLPSTNFVDEIISKAPSSTGTINSEGLMKVEQAATGQTPAQTEYRYSGANANVKNYVTFNDETWRIIGVFSTDNGSGTYEDRVRIIKDTKLSTDRVWNSSYPSDWTTASINTYLNGTYYNSLTSTAQGLINTAKWYISSTETGNTSSQQYSAERASTSYYGEEHTNWTGKIALMYPSDYGYASSGCYTGTKTLHGYNDSTCSTSNWLYNSGSYYWTVIPSAGGGFSDCSLIISDEGYITNGTIDSSYGVLPVTHLKSDVEVTGGSGTSSDPYTIG